MLPLHICHHQYPCSMVWMGFKPRTFGVNNFSAYLVNTICQSHGCLILGYHFQNSFFEVSPCVKLASCTGKYRDSERRKWPKVRVAETEEESLCEDCKKTFLSTPGIKLATAVSSSQLATPTYICHHQCECLMVRM